MKLVVIGASGHAKVVAEVAKSAGYTVECFVSEDKTEHFGLPVINMKEFLNSPFKLAAIGVGSNTARKNVYEELKQNNIECPTLIHASATISPSATIDEATLIMPGCIVNTDARIGVGCIVNSGVVIEHDCVLEDFVHVSPNAALAGGVSVGEMSHIGIGANVIQLIKIGTNCTIGAGAAVISDISDNTTAVGVPAKIIKENR